MKKRKYFRITFSCSEDELGAIRQTAKDCNLSMSMYCKKVVLGFRPKYRLSYLCIVIQKCSKLQL